MRAQGTPVVVSGKNGLHLAPELKTHRLVSLAANAGMALDADEEQMLERLTSFVEWAGRYPVGVSAAKTEVDPTWHQAADRDRAKQFIDRLTQRYKELGG